MNQIDPVKFWEWATEVSKGSVLNAKFHILQSILLGLIVVMIYFKGC